MKKRGYNMLLCSHFGQFSFSKESILFIFYFLICQVQFTNCQTSTQSACYDKNGIAKTCLTYPKNAALNRNVNATDTCGTPNEVSCQIGANVDRCRTCAANSSQNSHPPKNMVDFHNPTNITWWQSKSWWQTNLEGLSSLSQPLKVNVTISFKKLYLVTGSVRVTFYTVRPKRMIIQKSKDYGVTWNTYEYFAKNCLQAYSMAADPVITTQNRFLATCSQKFSNERPYVGGSVIFDPRLTRYKDSEYRDPNVQNYLAATDIRLVLEYPGTDGRENINSVSTLNQYYYAISDIVVDGRCACHGHAEYCDFRNGTEVCDCKHFTTGKDCEICLPLYRNRPWMAGNETNANECQRCQCHGHASNCIYNEQLRFGICENCVHNTRGSNCETCVEKFYRNVSRSLDDVNVCIPCDCFMFGVTDNGTCLQTATPPSQLGQCNCKPGVYGRRCDQCLPGKWGFAIQPIGTCFDCICNIFGTVGSNQTCDPYTGQCRCKTNIQGRTCAECKDTFHTFPTNISSDCRPCDCDFSGGFPNCDKLTGVCTCRRGIAGMQCTAVRNDYFFPNFTHVTSEVEMVSTGNHEYFWLRKDYRSFYLGIGQIKLNHGQTVTYTFQVPVTHSYFMVLRYSLYPLTWLNNLFLYGAESLTWTESQAISNYLSSSDNATNWKMNITVVTSSNSQLKSSEFSIGSLTVGNANIWNDTIAMQLSSGQIYRLSITYASISGSGIPWPIVIDSVVLLPDVRQSSYFARQSSAVMNEILNCSMQSKSLATTYALPSVCRKHVFSISVLMYNGSLACDCFTPGSNNTSTCEQYGGQCACKPGYGGRRCEHCLAGSYGDPNIGCVACGCSLAGSLTPVCNQTTGSCFCKANTQGAKCGNCKSSTFALTASNPDGCQSCYGFGHLVSCAAAKQFERREIFSNFTLSRNDGWTLINDDGSSANSQLQRTATGLQYIDEGRFIRYLVAPMKYLGNHLNSYGQLFTIEMSFVSLRETLRSHPWHVKLIGGGMTAVFSLFPTISSPLKTYNFRLHETFMTNETKLSEFNFKSLIGQLTAIHISVNYFQSGSMVNFNSIKVATANMTSSVGVSTVDHVENATCLIGYEGLSCERCSKGYTRAIQNGGPLVNCIPCNCNGRSTDCNPQSGICRNCQTGTTGDHCERCMPNLMQPNCTACMPGFWKISASGCQPCNCYLPGTINGNNIACDLVTGQCVCNSSMNVAGRQCNQCKQNAYNISLGELQCKQCPPCYTPIEQDYIIIRYQTNLLQNEISVLAKDPTLSPTIPLDQSLATLGILVSTIYSGAATLEPTVTSLNSSWNSLQTSANSLQSMLTSSTSTSVSNAVTIVTQVLASYNQSYASVVVISSNVITSYTQLSTLVANRILEQAAAVRQLNVLLNETSVSLRTVQSLSTQANSVKTTAISRVSQSLQIASLAANNSNVYQSMVTSLTSSILSLRSAVAVAQSQGAEMQTFATEMRSNASAVAVYASQILANVTNSIPDNSLTINSVSTTTTSLSTQISNLNTLISTATSNNNGVEEQISALKQANSILNSRLSTTERRFDSVKTRISASDTTTTAAISTAVNAETEAVSMLNTVQNFRSVSQQAAVDAANALRKVDNVQTIAYAASNVTSNVSILFSPIKAKVDQAMNLSTQTNGIAVTEKQNLDVIHNKAIKLRNETQSALNIIQGLQVQQYINTQVNPLLTRCLNYTTESRTLMNNVQTEHNQSQLAFTASQRISTTAVTIATSISFIPSIDMNQLTPINDNLLRIRQAYAALNIGSDLASLRAGLETLKVTISGYRSKVTSLKSQMNAYQTMYNSLNTLTCNVPSVLP